MKRIFNIHSVPHEPDAICTGATPSILLYEDTSKTPRDVHCLDLSGSEPKPASGKPVIHTQNNNIDDMCFVQDGDKQLLIVTVTDEYNESGDTDEIFAYNTETDKLEWTFCGKVPGMEKKMIAYGVTTDGRGHLFVGNYENNCILMFSVSDGQHLGCLLKDVETFKNPNKIYWCEETSSLIATECDEDIDKYLVKVISVKY